ncbi:hypothetical protein [Mesorhizobium sp. CAU 1732]|uniref:hypothetical protein n=1 Tax=Mesorhizobium sp. CAU 1732 TaxID=3140358 RepID=UPI003261B596
MRSAIVENGVVTNVIIGQVDDSITCGDDVAIGWTYDDGAFSPPPPPEPEPEPLPPLSPRQMGMMLVFLDMNETDVEDAIVATTIEGQERDVALVEWRKAAHYDRDHPLVDQLAAAMDFAPAELDDLWRYASTL